MLVKFISLSKIDPCLRKMQAKYPVGNLWNVKTRSLLGFVRTQSSCHDRDWIIELPWRLTVCHSLVFWHQRLLATPLVSPLISRSAYAGFLSYTFTTLRYAVGDGKLPAGSLSCVSVTVCYAIGDGETFTHGLLDCSVVCRTLCRSELCCDSPIASTQGTVEQSRMQTGSHRAKLAQCERLLSQMCMEESMCGKRCCFGIHYKIRKFVVNIRFFNNWKECQSSIQLMFPLFSFLH